MITREYSKLEIATFLRDFHKLMMLSIINPNTLFIDVFQGYMKSEKRMQYCTREYYSEMICVYNVMLASKFLTCLYDNYYLFLLEAKIEEINIPKKIFLNSNDASRFSKKNIIKNIRNAFNHNDNGNHELVKYVRVIKNGEGIPMVEINLKNTNPIPFHVRLDMEDLFSIIIQLKKANTLNVMSLRSKSPINLSSNNYNEELDKIFYRKFFSEKKLTDQQLTQIYELIKENEGTKNIEEQLANLDFEYKDFNFSIEQKLKIADDLKYWESKGIKGNDIISYLAEKVMPFSVMKDRTISINECLTNYYIKKGSYSISNFVLDAYKAYFTGIVERSSPFLLHARSFKIDNKFIYNVLDHDDIFSITSSIYYGYIFDTLITDQEINILNKKTLPRKRIRDSFVHMRWFLGTNRCFNLFDWGNRINDEFNENSQDFWSTNLTVQDLELSVDKYYNDFLECYKKDKNFMEFMPDIVLSEDDNTPMCIRGIKSGVLYIFSLVKNEDYDFGLYIKDERQELIIANDEQKILFLNMLDGLSDEQKEQYKTILQMVKLELLSSVNNNSSGNKKTI